jgi:hypothetical protein
MNLGDISKKVVPKIALVAAPQAGGHICTRFSFRTNAMPRSVFLRR